MATFLPFLFFSMFFQTALANKLVGPSEKLLKETTTKYRNAGLVEIDVEKLLKSDLNPAGKKFTGKIYLAGGLFRIENQEPEKSTLIYDGVSIWNEQPPSVDFPGPIQVSQTKINQKSKSQILFATLLTKEPVRKNFKILSAKPMGEGGKWTVFEAEPLAKDLNVKALKITISNKAKEVSEISYQDEIGNLTQMSFLKTKFTLKKNPKLFQYKPPKGAQVTKI